MEFVWFLLISVASGILAGMGMGGGTLLIPALTIIMGVEQVVAQSINLLVFVPCAIVCCIIYSKQKIVDFKTGWKIALSASIVSVIAVLFAVKIESKILSIVFGSFVAMLGVAQIVAFFIKKYKLQKQQKN